MIAAIFDVDWTILPGTSAERLFVKYLWRERRLGASVLWRWALLFLRHLSDLTVARAERVYLENQPIAEMEVAALACWQTMILPRLSADALQTIETHRHQGHAIVLLTGAPDLLMRPLAAHLKADACLCSVLEVSGDRYTGRTIPPYPYGAGKRDALLRFLEEHRLDLTRSSAYADSITDLPILELVGHPTVVNPDRRLGRLALERGWPVESWT